MEIILPDAFAAQVGAEVPVYVGAGLEKARVGTAKILSEDRHGVRFQLEFFNGAVVEGLMPREAAA